MSSLASVLKGEGAPSVELWVTEGDISKVFHWVCPDRCGRDWVLVGEPGKLRCLDSATAKLLWERSIVPQSAGEEEKQASPAPRAAGSAPTVQQDTPNDQQSGISNAPDHEKPQGQRREPDGSALEPSILHQQSVAEPKTNTPSSDSQAGGSPAPASAQSRPWFPVIGLVGSCCRNVRLGDCVLPNPTFSAMSAPRIAAWTSDGRGVVVDGADGSVLLECDGVLAMAFGACGNVRVARTDGFYVALEETPNNQQDKGNQNADHPRDSQGELQPSLSTTSKCKRRLRLVESSSLDSEPSNGTPRSTGTWIAAAPIVSARHRPEGKTRLKDVPCLVAVAENGDIHADTALLSPVLARNSGKQGGKDEARPWRKAWSVAASFSHDQASLCVCAVAGRALLLTAHLKPAEKGSCYLPSVSLTDGSVAEEDERRLFGQPDQAETHGQAEKGSVLIDARDNAVAAAAHAGDLFILDLVKGAVIAAGSLGPDSPVASLCWSKDHLDRPTPPNEPVLAPLFAGLADGSKLLLKAVLPAADPARCLRDEEGRLEVSRALDDDVKDPDVARTAWFSSHGLVVGGVRPVARLYRFASVSADSLALLARARGRLHAGASADVEAAGDRPPARERASLLTRALEALRPGPAREDLAAVIHGMRALARVDTDELEGALSDARRAGDAELQAAIGERIAAREQRPAAAEKTAATAKRTAGAKGVPAEARTTTAESLLERAAQAKERGNRFFAAKRYYDATQAYGAGIDALAPVGEAAREPLCVLLVNRSAALLSSTCHRACIEDCDRALGLLDKLQPEPTDARLVALRFKALFRKASALGSLEDPEGALSALEDLAAYPWDRSSGPHAQAQAVASLWDEADALRRKLALDTATFAASEGPEIVAGSLAQAEAILRGGNERAPAQPTAALEHLDRALAAHRRMGGRAPQAATLQAAQAYARKSQLLGDQPHTAAEACECAALAVRLDGRNPLGWEMLTRALVTAGCTWDACKVAVESLKRASFKSPSQAEDLTAGTGKEKEKERLAARLKTMLLRLIASPKAYDLADDAQLDAADEEPGMQKAVESVVNLGIPECLEAAKTPEDIAMVSALLLQSIIPKSKYKGWLPLFNNEKK